MSRTRHPRLQWPLLALLLLTALVTGGADAPPRTVASGTAAMLAPEQPSDIGVPAWLAEKVTAPVILFYFAPSCPHCQQAMPAVLALTEAVPIPWIGISTTSATQFEIDDFAQTHGADFPILQDDEERGFARAFGARSTPSVYLVRPAGPDAAPGSITLVESYAPFSAGMEGIFKIRRNRDNPFAAFSDYQGLQTCGGCHVEEARSWSLTRHAIAYRTLFARDRAQDLACVKCHVTGLGEPGGFAVGDHGSPHRDVNCEACHGVGGNHNPDTSTPVDPTSTCIGCHDAEHSIAFSVEKGLPHIDHFSALGLDDQAISARISAMMSGEAPRPLLAFPEGPTVGAKACVSCHKKSHKAWRRSPHHDAMASLKGEEKSDVGCVRCHATAAAFGGPESTEPSGFRTDEGVGCEACHGAGGAHLAQPSKDNIVGLGESCPECVIEAICTSCHTPKWDPAWALKTRLGAIEH